jgi:hypothetical protein
LTTNKTNLPNLCKVIYLPQGTTPRHPFYDILNSNFFDITVEMCGNLIFTLFSP